ncbi:DUF3955 domain-containing protein [Paenibacillus piri]|uniref:DUF3955 domain-containing protein n=1 Tax=Paenibacillus piri TaxID=2547395 RepID=A0A4R5KIR2_9BACL|nr:DUF3955 domain-containing protein [Paenibacillus piri]TDF95409.1 DUF3955 domain-containing protein [Paenibacillus piri]
MKVAKYLPALMLFIAGIGCLVARSNIGTEIAPDGTLLEPFFLIPIGYHKSLYFTLIEGRERRTRTYSQFFISHDEFDLLIYTENLARFALKSGSRRCRL